MSLKNELKEAALKANKERKAAEAERHHALEEEHQKYVDKIERAAFKLVKDKFSGRKVRRYKGGWPRARVWTEMENAPDYGLAVDHMFSARYNVDDMVIEVEGKHNWSDQQTETKNWKFTFRYNERPFSTLAGLGQLIVNEEAGKQR
jgi:hypothetical protein